MKSSTVEKTTSPPASIQPRTPGRRVDGPNGVAEAAAPESAIPRRLLGRRVLLDTYNLRLKKGSGIKTYGLTLAEALKELGAETSLLSDRPVPRSRRKALDEVFFYDHRRREGRISSKLKGMLRSVKRSITPVATASIGNEYVVPDSRVRDVPGVRCIYNVGRIYDTANEVYRKLGRFTTVKLSQPVDVWHATTLLPIRVKNAAMITTIHDVIPLRLPYTTLDNKKFFYNIVRDCIRASDLILTVSECTKRDILRFFDVPPDKIEVTYQAVPFHIYQPNQGLEESAMKRHGLERGKYMLFVGNIEPKKNLGGIIQAASAIPGDMPLVVVGRKGWLWEEELELAQSHFGREVKRRFRLLSYVPRRELHALYACAGCLVFPSLYEGFGLPPVEAFAHGCPVVCSNVASLPEVCGDAALYCDPYDPDSIRRRIEELFEDDGLRRQLIAAGYKRLDEFSTARYAERLADAYEKVLM